MSLQLLLRRRNFLIIVDSKEVSALIEGNGDDIGEVDAVDELHWM